MQFSGFRKMLVALVVLFTAQAQATLIVNGGFESNAVAKGKWNYFHSSIVPGWEGSNIEIWHQLNNVHAQEGLQHAELNAHGKNHGAWSIYQTFQTTFGHQYDFSFYYRARIANKESFKVSVGDFEQIILNYNTKAWQQFQGSFLATGSQSSIRFTSMNSGTYGNFLDNVVVNPSLSSFKTSAVPVGSSLALLVLGLLTFLSVRRR